MIFASIINPTQVWHWHFPTPNQAYQMQENALFSKTIELCPPNSISSTRYYPGNLFKSKIAVLMYTELLLQAAQSAGHHHELTRNLQLHFSVSRRLDALHWLS